MLEILMAITLVASAVTAGLVAGLFFGFAVAIMPALRTVPDRDFVDMMQRINTTILNPWFLSVYIGAGVLIAASALIAVVNGHASVIAFTVAALVLYGGVLALTGVRNIPLNVEFAAVDVDDSAHLSAARERFEVPWCRFNVIRMGLAIGAVICLGVALLL
ncbi:DUF1772 domain-containing protein [Hoyosella rhizosphaerae]|uniref:Membrane protein n=1 Tax=Hoyosella rhizosphaerae TaxID=1755582 RepID=A0A916U270_9ACTN|nr:anthrone oxygenase family protein [Hoyosella rhizosphaerae]MBN4926616.1 DUF1772 domain-containing protein [Hoyosella rhizosphaerae]GGC57899.1 membrane protein [Hoyosella rhizosphaerae]